MSPALVAKRLLIVAHAPSANTVGLRDALVAGAEEVAGDAVALDTRSPFATDPEAVRAAQAVVLMTTENLGYMSGALKDFFDRIYNPCLELTQGQPYAALIRAGHDGTGTRRAIESITTGLRWRAVHAPVVCRGPWQEAFLGEARALGAHMAAGLEAGIF